MVSSKENENASLWKRINRRGGSFLLVACLFGVTVLSHLMAVLKMGCAWR